MADPHWETVASSLHRPMAEFLASVLDGHGIPARVTGDDGGGMAYPTHLGMGGILVQVPAARAAEARAVLDDRMDVLETAELERQALEAEPPS